MKRAAIGLLATLSVACGGPASNGPPPGEKSLEGVAAIGAPIAGVTLTFKDATGATATAVTAADGSYSLRTATLAFPVLLRIDSPQGPLFSSAFASGVTNVHPFTNLVVRNWYKVQGIDVDTAFSGTQPIAVPSEAEIATIEAVVVDIIGTMLADAGIDRQSFDLFNSPFKADGTGLDQVLDRTEISIDPATSGATIATRDPVTGLPTELALDLSRDLGREDSVAPSLPTGLAATVAGESAIVLTWTPSTDDVAVTGYDVYRDGTQVARSPYPVFKDARLQAGTRYCYAVQAVDAKGNVSAKTAPICATTLTAADVTAPSVPAVLEAVEAKADAIVLGWAPSSDENGVLGYRILRGGTVVATVSGPRFEDTGLTPGTTYCYTVTAFDAAGNVSAASAALCVTTSQGGGGGGSVGGQATGTYTFDSGALLLRTELSSGCNAAEAGASDLYAVAEVTATQLTMYHESGALTVWTRPGGTADDLVGSWRTTIGGVGYLLALRADGTWSLDWDGCGAPDDQAAAQGTYTYDAPALTIETTESSHCNGPAAGSVVTHTVSDFTATSMTWTNVDDASDTLLWSRAAGVAGELAGTWTMTKEERSYTLTVRADGTWSLVWDPGVCDEVPPGIANGAQGQFSYEGDILTLHDVAAQSCNEPPAWLGGSFAVADLTESSMSWTLVGTSGPALVWTRAEPGTGVLGLWVLTEGERTYRLELNAEGAFGLTWDGPCDVSGQPDFTAGSYHFETGTLVLDVAIAPDCKPLPYGPSTFSVSAQTADSMTWSHSELGTMSWTRVTAPVEGLLGTWVRAADSGEQHLTFHADGTFELVWAGAVCEPPDSNP